MTYHPLIWLVCLITFTPTFLLSTSMLYSTRLWSRSNIFTSKVRCLSSLNLLGFQVWDITLSLIIRINLEVLKHEPYMKIFKPFNHLCHILMIHLLNSSAHYTNDIIKIDCKRYFINLIWLPLYEFQRIRVCSCYLQLIATYLLIVLEIKLKFLSIRKRRMRFYSSTTSNLRIKNIKKHIKLVFSRWFK